MILTFSFEVVSGHTITIQWYKDDVAVVDGTYDGVVVVGATTNTMTITDPTAAWNGEYYAIVTDSTAECTTQTDPVDVEVPAICSLSITTQPISQTLDEWDTLELTVAATGAVGTFTYQWFLDGVALTDGVNGDAIISGATSATLTVTHISDTLAGDYTVAVTDDGFADCSVESDTAVVAITNLEPPINMYIWYKADGETAYYNAGDVTFPAHDFSGNGFDLDISDDAPPIQPTLEIETLNDLPVFEWSDPFGSNVTILFTNVFDLATSGFPVTSTGYTFAVVIKCAYNASFDNLIVAALNDGFVTTGYLRALTDPTNCTFTHLGNTTSCSLVVGIDTWQIVTGTFDFVEGIPRLRTNDAVAVGSVGAGSVLLNLAQLQGSNSGDEMIAEVLYYNVKLSDGDLAQLRAYLSAKWDIAITV
jgi:hypothetical protein